VTRAASRWAARLRRLRMQRPVRAQRQRRRRRRPRAATVRSHSIRRASQPRRQQVARARPRHPRLQRAPRLKRRRARRTASWCSCRRKRARPKRSPPSAACRRDSRTSLAGCSQSFAARISAARACFTEPWSDLLHQRTRRASSARATRLPAANASFRITGPRWRLASGGGGSGQMAVRAFITGLAGTTLTDGERAFLREREPWGFILFSRNIDTPAQLSRLITSLRDAVSRDTPVFVDQEGRLVHRLAPP